MVFASSYPQRESLDKLVYTSLLCYGAHMVAELIDDSVPTIFAGDTPCIRTFMGSRFEHQRRRLFCNSPSLRDDGVVDDYA